ncbi:MAG: MBL fold metallo-hydrolase [Candidatus Omnitrophota bacterium]
MKKIALWFVLLAFVSNCILPSRSMAQVLNLPAPGTMVLQSPAFTPAQLQGMVVYPNDPFKFDFIIKRSDELLTSEAKQAQYSKLIKYFLAALAVPDTDQWVNLSPYEKDRIIPDVFGKTEMGRDLLAQDYILKQISSSLINPDTAFGKRFWDQVYEVAYKRFGTTDIPTDMFNKVWVVPSKAVIYEKDNTVYVLEHHLKVMMATDYEAMNNAALSPGTFPGELSVDTKAPRSADRVTNATTQELAQNILRAIIIPEIEIEVNKGKNFAQLRQVYSGMLLAAWYKRALKESILTKVYADQSKVKGIEQDPVNNQRIYDQYVTAFKAGAFNLIKEDLDQYAHEVIPRKYFSGGAVSAGVEFDKPGYIQHVQAITPQGFNDAAQSDIVATLVRVAPADLAMVAGVDRDYHYPAGEVDIALHNPNRNYVKTSQGVISLGISMLHRALVPEKDDFPAVIVAPPSGNWVGQDGSNLMQAYFAIAANYAFHGRKTVVVVKNEQEKERVIKYLDLGNPYFLPNEAGYSQAFIDQLRREAIVLADRVRINGRWQIISPAQILESHSDATTMVDFKVMSQGQAQVGGVGIVDQKDGSVRVIDGDQEAVLDGNPWQEMNVAIAGVEPLKEIPQFGVTFLGTSGAMDSNGLASSQVIWVGQKGVLVDAGPAVVGSLTALKISPDNMGYVVLTHMHEDHVAGMLSYFAWLKHSGRSIKMLAEPGIYKFFKEQAEIILNAPLESFYDVQLISLKFNETTVVGAGEEAFRIKSIPAFHGSPTLQFQISYKGRAISHSSDTTMAPLRLDTFSREGLPGISEDIKNDLKRFTDYQDGQIVFDQARAQEIKDGLFRVNEDGKRPELVIYEAGYGKPGTVADVSNHTSAYDLGNLPEDDQKKIVVNHTAQLPQGVSPFIRQARAFQTIDLFSVDLAMSDTVRKWISILGLGSALFIVGYAVGPGIVNVVNESFKRTAAAVAFRTKERIALIRLFERDPQFFQLQTQYQTVWRARESVKKMISKSQEIEDELDKAIAGRGVEVVGRFYSGWLSVLAAGYSSASERSAADFVDELKIMIAEFQHEDPRLKELKDPGHGAIAAWAVPNILREFRGPVRLTALVMGLSARSSAADALEKFQAIHKELDILNDQLEHELNKQLKPQIDDILRSEVLLNSKDYEGVADSGFQRLDPVAVRATGKWGRVDQVISSRNVLEDQVVVRFLDKNYKYFFVTEVVPSKIQARVEGSGDSEKMEAVISDFLSKVKGYGTGFNVRINYTIFNSYSEDVSKIKIDGVMEWFRGTGIPSGKMLYYQSEDSELYIKEKPFSSDKAMVPGGIDMNAANLDLQIKRNGNGVLLPVGQQNFENIHIEGLVPVILDIKPAMTMSLFAHAVASAT